MRRQPLSTAATADIVFRPDHFLNRELSWIAFNQRVLEEAMDETTPLLERLKFLSIVSSNLDEFFMVRVAGLREQAFQEGAPQDLNPDGLRAIDQLVQISIRVREQVSMQYDCLNKMIIPRLDAEGIHLVRSEDVHGDRTLDAYFQQIVFPIITPMAIDPSHPQPRYHNRSLYLVAKLRRRSGLGPRELFAVVHIPHVLPRLVPISNPKESHEKRFILLEDLVAARMPDLFGGFQVQSHAAFRLTRDSDIEIIQQESDDMLQLIEERLKERTRADAVRLEITAGADESLVDLIVQQEELRMTYGAKNLYNEVYHISGPLDLTGLSSLASLPTFDYLRDPPIVPQVPRGLRRKGEDIFSAIRRRDILMHHPYDSFASVVDFVKKAAEDANVLAIKQTLYRTSGDSPIVAALIQAAESGKHVTAIVELKARFDEAANVSWARKMERSGVHVVYGFMDLKTHCKVSLVVRREDHAVRRYVHLSTGNYNPATATIYTDLGLFTADESIAVDVSALFNLLTGYSQSHEWQKLMVAPRDLHWRTTELIEEQTLRAQKGKSARIFAKLNSLVDPFVIESLYRASRAGVKIDLVIRGICCLRPGIPQVSENIRVFSVVDRFLEHSRVLVFGQEEQAKVFLSSADWMPRNFYRRVEIMFPVESPALRKRILHEIVPAYLADNCKSRELMADGLYRRVHRDPNAPIHRSQIEFMRREQEILSTGLASADPYIQPETPPKSRGTRAG
jgi:polyphosphate kinase